jgi:aminoglycoside phosphotransferase (APT) family kinase protein
MTSARAAVKQAPERAARPSRVRPPPDMVARPSAHAATAEFKELQAAHQVDTTPPHLTAAISHTQVHPDPYPVPVFAATLLSTGMAIFTAGRQVDHAKARREVEAFDLLHEPPLVQQYRAEVLAWLDRKGA